MMIEEARLGVKPAPVALVGAAGPYYDTRVGRVAVLLSLLPVACSSGASRVRIIDSVDAEGRLGFADVTLTTLDDLETVSGGPVELFGGATLELATFAAIDGGAIRGNIVSHPRRVHARWVMDGDVAVACDFDSLLMFTAYAHFEASALLFASIGYEVTTDAVPVYYEPELENSEAAGLSNTDNAAFFVDADAFILLPMAILRDVPFGMNPGVIAHEYSHRVWYYAFWSGELFATLDEFNEDASTGPAYNRIRATDEGVADFYGAVLTGDPEFLAESVPSSLAAPRSLNEIRILEPAWIAGELPVDERNAYAVYVPGAVVGSTLWGVAQTVGVEEVARAVLAAQRTLAPTVTRTFRYEYGDLETETIARLPASSRPAACARFHTSYAAAWNKFSAVCP